MENIVEASVDAVLRNANDRIVAIWGGGYKYSVQIQKLLKNKVKDIIFIDNDQSKQNNLVFSPNYVYKNGGKERFYVVCPILFHKEIKEELINNSFKNILDFFYFHDDVVVDESDYFEDKRGNKIIGNYKGFDIAFIGDNNIIKINGQNTGDYNLKIRLECNSYLEIGENCKFVGGTLYACLAKIVIGNNCFFQSRLKIASYAYSSLNIGNNTSISHNCFINVDHYTNISIGDNCMFSFDCVLQSNDGHPIFDLNTGKNINNSVDIAKQKKIVLENHVWLGMRVICLGTTLIKEGSVVGAASLVKKEFSKKNCILAGSPAKIIREDIRWEKYNPFDKLHILNT
ncbi:MAG: acyltransferase [Treponemataceae bacterium]